MNASDGILSIEQMVEVGRKLLELRPLEELLGAVIQTAARTMHAETAMVILRDRPSGALTVAATWQEGDEEPPTLENISRSLLDEAFLHRRPVLTESAVEDPRFAGKSSIILQHIQAAVIVPLAEGEEVEGALYLDSRSDRDLFRAENLPALSTLAAFAVLAMENARRYDSTRQELAKLKDAGELRKGSLIGSASAMQELYAMLDRVAATDLPAFIGGESGTGKELVAREIHNASPRAARPFVPLYCGNISSELFESELFGHVLGSFTGAVADKPGLVVTAQGGTLFLDEVADIPIGMQAKLLRFLQSGEFRPVGDTTVRRADVRIIAATNKELSKEIAEGRFREDLYYRLYILPVRVPALRERLTDIPLLVRHFLRKGRGTLGGPTGISPNALRFLMGHSWPGNVRELENVITRARVIAQGERIEIADLVGFPNASPQLQMPDLSWAAAERRHVLEVLSLCDNNKSKAAKVLGISRRYLYYKLEEWESPGGKS